MYATVTQEAAFFAENVIVGGGGGIWLAGACSAWIPVVKKNIFPVPALTRDFLALALRWGALGRSEAHCQAGSTCCPEGLADRASVAGVCGREGGLFEEVGGEAGVAGREGVAGIGVEFGGENAGDVVRDAVPG